MSNVLVAGGAGFLGSNLCAALLERGDNVVCVDNLSTGRRENIAVLEGKEDFIFIDADITKPIPKELHEHHYDAVVNMASPASPPRYVELALETLQVGSLGTQSLLDIAERDAARFVQASTSEVYGDPDIHPQPESYWGNVNSYGARAMYDESKRYAEALIWVYHYQRKVNTGIIRIFNTYGPNMDPEDGRVVSNFIVQALSNKPITLYGEGKQTRSFCYVSDQVAAFLKMIDGDLEGPVNVGNPDEFTMVELAEKVIRLTGSSSKMVHQPLPPDDPKQRRPDIAKAKAALNWAPKISLEDGLPHTIAYFRCQLQR